MFENREDVMTSSIPTVLEEHYSYKGFISGKCSHEPRRY